MDNNIIDKKMSKLSSNLEGTLRKYLKCIHADFGVKNELFLEQNWTKSVNFTLGVKYARATAQRQSEIKDFLENGLKGENIKDLVENSKYYCLGDKNGALEYISQTITKIQYLLSDEI
ncbi:hypothetical protein H2279_07740 [Campylobacter sp. B0100352/1]|uniref:hypothetical protein n=1 Tax=Campylobacter sp. B0100352/1 TaxID=2735783 RepID=UPI001DE5988C|nr:hypothetical protein [Campylobacter sp. B0100352/1]